LVLTGALAAGAPARANDLTLPKTPAAALKSACDKARQVRASAARLSHRL